MTINSIELINRKENNKNQYECSPEIYDFQANTNNNNLNFQIKLFCCCCCCLFYLIIIASFHILPCLHFSSLLIINFYKQNTNANFFFVCSQKIEPHSLNHYIDSLSLSSSSSSSHTHLSVHL